MLIETDFFFFFFFQAEDGIRDADVTGVQTCALPISLRGAARPARPPHLARPVLPDAGRTAARRERARPPPARDLPAPPALVRSELGSAAELAHPGAARGAAPAGVAARGGEGRPHRVHAAVPAR